MKGSRRLRNGPFPEPRGRLSLDGLDHAQIAVAAPVDDRDGIALGVQEDVELVPDELELQRRLGVAQPSVMRRATEGLVRFIELKAERARGLEVVLGTQFGLLDEVGEDALLRGQAGDVCTERLAAASETSIPEAR